MSEVLTRPIQPAEPTALIVTQKSPSFAVPGIITDAGEHATRRFVEFFTANIRNRNTRGAYAHAVGRFLDWCGSQRLGLKDLEPFVIAAYIEQLMAVRSAPTVKQHLAAIRMLMDWLVIGQVIPFNPAASVRGPRYVVKKGKTLVLSPDQARQLIASIDTSTLIGMRDRALIGTMVYSFARVSAVVGMNVEDYWQNGKRCWLRLHEKGGKEHEVPAHHKAEEYLDAYVHSAGLAGEHKSPLFRTVDGRADRLTSSRMDRRGRLADDSAESRRRRIAKAYLLSHFSRYRNHGLSGERRDDRKCSGDCRPRISANDQAIRSHQ